MSYIRSTNNPEEMYIWCNHVGDVTIMQGSTQIGSAPAEVFEKLIDIYKSDQWSGEWEVEGLRLVEDVKKDGKFLNKLSYYETWECYMYGVTWDYIVYTNNPKRPTFFDWLLRRKVRY